MVTLSRSISMWMFRRWVKETRYYEIYLHQDLWDGWVVTCVWGRRRTAMGRVQHRPCESYELALALFAEIEKRRNQHGYVEMDMKKAEVREGA